MYMIKVAKITSHQPVQHALCTTLLGMAVFHIVRGLLVWVSCNGFHLFLPLFLRNLRRRTPDATLLHAFRRYSFLNTLSTVLCSICEIKGWEFLVPIISPPPPELKKTQQQQQGLSAVRMEFQRGQGTRKRSHSSPRLPLHQQFKMAPQNYTNNLKDASMTIKYLIYSLIIVTITNKHVFVITHCVLTLEGMTACYIFCAGPRASFPYRTDHQLAIHRPHEHIQQWEPPFLWQNK